MDLVCPFMYLLGEKMGCNRLPTNIHECHAILAYLQNHDSAIWLPHDEVKIILCVCMCVCVC